jgi:hypothetical protein
MRRIETLGSWGEIWQNLILDRITAEPRKKNTQAAKNTHLQNLPLNIFKLHFRSNKMICISTQGILIYSFVFHESIFIQPAEKETRIDLTYHFYL